MISVAQADKFIKQYVKPLTSERIALEESIGRLLDESLKTDRPVPSYDRVMMDGVAINLRLWKKGTRSFTIQGVQAAGKPPKILRSPQHAIEVMTGAVLPSGCDVVIPYEECLLSDGQVEINQQVTMESWQCIHRKGSDARKGEVVLTKGKVLTAPDVAIAASVGKTHVRVIKSPSVVIIATGDELVSPGKPIQDHQVYLSNPYGLLSAFKAHGINQIDVLHCKDDPKKMHTLLKKALRTHDVIIFSGGISKGKYDYVRNLLLKEKVKEVFYCVAQRPGKPLWFGVGKKKQVVFALPGNPISVIICAYRYVLPALYAMAGKSLISQQVTLSKAVVNHFSRLTFFMPVKYHQGKVTPVAFQNSGDYLSLTYADGFVELKQNMPGFKKGTEMSFFKY